jgi:hypothetical protein
MSTSENLQTISRDANADLSTKQYLCVKAVSGGKVDVCSAITDVPIGVLQDKPASGKAACVGIGGVTKVVVNGAIAVGIKVAPTAAGKVQTAVSTQYPIGVLLTAGGADGDIVEMLIDPSTVPLP